MREKVRNLIGEIDYQDIDYDTRVDLFNKYKIPTSQKYFNPIFGMCSIVADMLDINQTNRRIYSYGMSHSGAILSSFNNTFNLDKDKNKSHSLDVVSTNNFDTYRFKRYEKGEYVKHIDIIIYDEDKIGFRLHNVTIFFTNPIDPKDNVIEYINDLYKALYEQK